MLVDNSAQNLQTNFIQSALEAHNACRLKHHVEPLKHNSELSKRAQQHADYLAQMGQRNLVHSQNRRNIGENLALYYNSATNYYTGKWISFDFQL
jgi:uncharacterized protein YkwD